MVSSRLIPRNREGVGYQLCNLVKERNREGVGYQVFNLVSPRHKPGSFRPSANPGTNQASVRPINQPGTNQAFRPSDPSTRRKPGILHKTKKKSARTQFIESNSSALLCSVLRLYSVDA